MRYGNNGGKPSKNYRGSAEYKSSSYERRSSVDGSRSAGTKRYSGNERKPAGRISGDRRKTDERSSGAKRPVGSRSVPERTRTARDIRTEVKGPSYDAYEFLPAEPVTEARQELLKEEREVSYILTGRNPIREALKNNRDLEKLMVQKGDLSGSATEIVSMAKERKIMVQVVEKSRLDEIDPHHQGLIAIASAFRYATVEDMLQLAGERGEAPFLVLLDGITDPHNLGAIIRSAECAGAHGVIVPQHRSVGLTPAAVKASAGAVEYLPVARVTNLNRTIEELQKQNIWVYALTMDGTDYENVSFSGGTAVVIGAEGSGISKLTEEKCDLSVSLPMKGHIDSLNASVAAGIILYRIFSSRKG